MLLNRSFAPIFPPDSFNRVPLGIQGQVGVLRLLGHHGVRLPAGLLALPGRAQLLIMALSPVAAVILTGHLLGILLLIVPTLLFLVLSGLIITGGVMAVTSAFGSGIAVFADIMVIIGMAFILLALGLLALWIAVWLVGGAMVGLVRGLIHLGGKWCYKEVEA